MMQIILKEGRQNDHLCKYEGFVQLINYFKFPVWWITKMQNKNKTENAFVIFLALFRPTAGRVGFIDLTLMAN